MWIALIRTKGFSPGVGLVYIVDSSEVDELLGEEQIDAGWSALDGRFDTIEAADAWANYHIN